MVFFNRGHLFEQIEKYNRQQPCLRKQNTNLTYSAPLNVIETKEKVTVEAEFPGVSKENISIEIKDNQLIISAEKKRLIYQNEKQQQESSLSSTESSSSNQDRPTLEDYESGVEINNNNNNNNNSNAKEEKEETIYHCVERKYGTFKRILDLSKLHSLDISNIEATHNNGLLTITIPKDTKLNSITISIQ